MLGLLIPMGGGDPIPLLKPTLIVGRRPSCDIQLDYANVSSKHCRLEYINGYWRAADTSTNGTKVNGERIDEKFLQPGDTIGFAKHFFEIQYTPDPEAAPPVEEEADPFALSLLEKAGLSQNNSRERRERRDRERERAASANKPKPSNGSSRGPSSPVKGPTNEEDDDKALEWLKG